MELFKNAPSNGVQLSFNETKMTITSTEGNGFVETYDMCQAPTASMSLVRYSRSQALQQLSLETLTKDLARAADLMFLAYNGVAGTGKLAASVSARQKQFGDLAQDSVATMILLRDKSGDIIAKVVSAFKALIDVDEEDEEEALYLLESCGKFARAMAEKCGTLAKGFEKLKKETGEDAYNTEIAIGAQIEIIKEINKLKKEVAATLAKQQKIAEELDRTIKELKEEIDEAKAEEDKESERSFILSIVGAVTGAIGTAVSALVSAKTDPTGVKGMLQNQQSLKPENNEQVKEAKAKKEAKEAELSKAKKEQEEAEKSISSVKNQKSTIEQDISNLKTQKDDLEKKLASAPEADKKGIQDKIENLAKDIDKKKQSIKPLDEQIEAGQGKLETAKAVASAAAEALKELAGRLDKMVETAEKRYESARALRLSLISQKRADEEARREALGQIAEMTELLKAHNTSAEIEESSQVALEMAKWAFDNIYVAFTNAKFFWDNMAIFCDKLASEELREDIERKAKKYTREKRIKLFKKEEFVKSSIMYLANWKALQVVCAEYVEHSYDIRGIILSNIAKSPTVSEARAQMADLKKRILGDIEADKQLSQQATSELVELQNIFSGL